MRSILRFAKKSENKYGEICAVSEIFAFIYANIWEDKRTILRSARTTLIIYGENYSTLGVPYKKIHCKYLRFFWQRS